MSILVSCDTLKAEFLQSSLLLVSSVADLRSGQEKNADRRQTKNSFIAEDETWSCVVSLGQECLYLRSLRLTYTHTHTHSPSSTHLHFQKCCQPQNIAGILRPEWSQEVGSNSISGQSGACVVIPDGCLTPDQPNPAWPDTLTLLDLRCRCIKSTHKCVIFLATMTSWKVPEESLSHHFQMCSLNAGTVNPAHKFVYSCGSFSHYWSCKRCFKREPLIFAGHPGNRAIILLKHAIFVIYWTPSFVICFGSPSLFFTACFSNYI